MAAHLLTQKTARFRKGKCLCCSKHFHFHVVWLLAQVRYRLTRAACSPPHLAKPTHETGMSNDALVGNLTLTVKYL